MGEKNQRLAFGLLLGAGWLGAHRFYLHRYASGAAQLLLSLAVVALWIWGGSLSRWAPYCIAFILFWLLHDGFWLYDYFRVEEEMDTSLADFVDSDTTPMAVRSDSVKRSRLQALVAVADDVAEAEQHKKIRAIRLAKKQIADSLHDNHPLAAHTAAERLLKYLQQRSRRPQADPFLAEAYLLHGMVLYQTQYADAARKKLQMGVHLGASFSHLSGQVQQAQGWLLQLRNPQGPVAAAGAAQPAAVQPSQYEALMQAGEWAQAEPLCAQTIALRRSAKIPDIPDLAQHYLHAMEIALKLGQPQAALAHGQQLQALVAHKSRKDASQSLVPVPLQRQMQERLGDLAYSAGDHPTAHQHYRDALVLATAHQARPAQVCGLLQRLALNFERVGDIEKARGCWAKAAAHIAQLEEVAMEDSEAVSDVLTRYAAFSVQHQPALVKPLIEQALRIQHRAYRGYSLAAARAYEVFASFMAEISQPAMRRQHLRQALLLYQVCDPDNATHLAHLKKAIAAAEAVQAAPPAQGGQA